MSYGNAPRGSRSGGKGSSPKKSNRKKKQEFHVHRQQLQATEAPSAEDAKAKAIAALEKLGHQRLSIEPGGYDLQSWVRSLNSLLDDLQARLGEASLPPEYFKKRDEVVSGVLTAADLSETDRNIARLRREADEEEAMLEGERKRILERLGAIEAERNRMAAELEDAQGSQGGAAGDGQKGSFFGRLLGRDRGQVKEMEEKAAQAKSTLTALAAEDAALRVSLERLNDVGEGSQAQKLSVLKSKIVEAQAEKEQMMQLGEERERFTNELVELISRAQPGGQSPTGSVANDGPEPESPRP